MWSCERSSWWPALFKPERMAWTSTSLEEFTLLHLPAAPWQASSAARWTRQCSCAGFCVSRFFDRVRGEGCPHRPWVAKSWWNPASVLRINHCVCNSWSPALRLVMPHRSIDSPTVAWRSHSSRPCAVDVEALINLRGIEACILEHSLPSGVLQLRSVNWHHFVHEKENRGFVGAVNLEDEARCWDHRCRSRRSCCDGLAVLAIELSQQWGIRAGYLP